MTDVVKKIGNFTPLLSVIVTIVTIVAFFYRVDATMIDIETKQKAHVILTSSLATNIEKQNIYLKQLVDLAKNADDDSGEMKVVLAKLSVTLDNINDKLK